MDAQTAFDHIKSFIDTKHSELAGRLLDLEQNATRPGFSGPAVKSYGEQLAESDQFKQLQANKYHGTARIEMKAITTAGGSAGGLIQPAYDNDVAPLPRRQFFVRNLLTVIPTTSGSIIYPKQTVRVNNAAPVPETTAKPYSNYGWTGQTVQVRTIAHLAKLSRQALDDATQLQAEVDSEMRYGLQLAEDAQILLGDGTGENLLGLLPQATAYALPTGFTMPASPNRVDQLAAAILQAVLTNIAPDGVVLHPVDWMQIRILKGADGKYLFGNPGADVEPRLFGLPVATSMGMTVGGFLLGAFKAQKLYDRLQPEVLISSENADDFEKNLLTMRAEERLALAVRQPGALIKGTFA